VQHQDDDEQELPQGKDEEQEPHGSSFISIGIHFMFSPSHAIAMGIGNGTYPASQDPAAWRRGGEPSLLRHDND